MTHFAGAVLDALGLVMWARTGMMYRRGQGVTCSSAWGIVTVIINVARQDGLILAWCCVLGVKGLGMYAAPVQEGDCLDPFQ